jgi:Mg2+ and Co2+ transporter CorA
MSADGHLLLVLHRPPRPDDDQRTGRFFWRAPDGQWMSSDLGKGPQAMLKHLGEYIELIEKYDRQEEQADEAEDYFRVLRDLLPLLRAARNLHQVLQEGRRSCPEDRDLINFRDRSYEIERTAELLYNGTQHGLDYAVARRSEEQARSSHAMAVSAHRLNLLAAFFFPLATLAAVFGMNLTHGLERISGPIPFVVLLLVGLALGFALRAVVAGEHPLRPPPKPRDRYTR